MKIKILLLLLFVGVFISSCNNNNNPVANGGNTVIQKHFITLAPTGWIVDPNNENQWYQSFNVPFLIPDNENYTIIVYYKNEYSEWSALPFSKLYYTKVGGIPVTQEFGYSYKGPSVVVTFRFPLAGATAYDQNMDLKVIMLSQY